MGIQLRQRIKEEGKEGLEEYDESGMLSKTALSTAMMALMKKDVDLEGGTTRVRVGKKKKGGRSKKVVESSSEEEEEDEEK
jgi:hypothetical protein